MGQSNSTSPLLVAESHETFKEFNYSRLLTHPSGNSASQTHDKFSGLVKKSPVSYFKLNRFESLNGDNLLVKDREEKVGQRFESQKSASTFKNITNLKLSKKTPSIQNSKQQLTSISHLQLPHQESLTASQKSKPPHITFHSSHRLVCKNYIIQKRFSEDKKKFSTKIINYFVDEEDMENYISNLIKLKQVLMDLDLYQDFSILQEEGLFIIERQFGGEIDFSKGKLTKYILKDNVPLLLDYLCFLAKIYRKIDDIYVDPEDVYFDGHEFYLLDFKYKQVHPFEMILATLEWIFKTLQPDPNQIIQELTHTLKVSDSNKTEKTLQDCFVRKNALENSLLFPLYIRQLWKNLVEKKIQRDELLPYLTRLKCKASTLSMKIDSFHACLQHKKTAVFQEEKHAWILAKKCNEIYFYNINDDHRCHVKVVRKKKKIDLSQIKIVFDPEELQIKYIAQNSKLVVHISQFQLEKFSCLSDIQIKYRLPVKFKNPFIFYNNKHQQIFILQNCVYKYSICHNKIYQETKKISECIFLSRSYDFAYLVIKLSIDIFKNGIKVFVNQTEVDLFFVAEESILEEVSNIRVDIRVVDFCKEIYKGVYLMMANRNMWILDLNFNVFYSFATIQRVKKFYGFASVGNTASHSKGIHHHRAHSRQFQSSSNHTDYAFEIFNQPFKAEFLTYQEGLHAKIKDDQLHIIGEIQGNMYYLSYLFMPEAGSLRLLSYKPLFGIELKAGSNDETGTIKSFESDESAENIKNDKVQKKRVRIAENTVELEGLKPNAENLKKQALKESSLGANLKPRASNLSVPRRSRQVNEASMAKLFKETQMDMNVYQFYHFNFHEQNLPSYKNDSWLFFNDHLFIKPEDFYLKTNKTNYEIQLKIKKTKYSLRDLIEKIKKSNENKSFKERKSISKEECMLYMLRCLEIYEWLVQNDLDHRNLSISNLYFMEADNSLKLIGWSEPPRNWYVSDFKDLLLVCFNIITCNSFEKLNQKMLFKYKTQLEQFSVIYDKMQTAFKFMKVSEKKAEIEKQVKEIKEQILKELTNRFLLGEVEQKSSKMINIGTNNDLGEKQRKELVKMNSNEFIFNFEYNTPRFSMVSILKKKMKKMKCLLDQNSKEELIFKSTDKYLWNEQKGSLYMFTSTYQFYELKINTQSFKEETLICQEYEYLPNNIVESSFVFVPSHGIISIGGIYKAKDTQLTFNHIVYQFNFEKLTWDTLCEIPEPRVNPYIILSREGKDIYCLGGETEHSSQNMHILKLDLSKANNQKKQVSVELLIDPLPFNPISQVLATYPSKIYNISSELQLFLLFAITPDKYLVRLFSLNSFCLDLHLEAKNYADDNKIISSTVGILLNKGTMHVLRQYGKYAKICMNKLQSLAVINETIYPERQDNKVE